MFVDPDGVNELFDTLADRFSGATFIFDVINPAYLEQANGGFSEINAPMQWGVIEDELNDFPIKVDDVRYLLLEHPDRWDELGIDASKRTQDRSGFVVASTLK